MCTHLSFGDSVSREFDHGEVSFAERALDVVEAYTHRPAERRFRLTVSHDHASRSGVEGGWGNNTTTQQDRRLQPRVTTLRWSERTDPPKVKTRTMSRSETEPPARARPLLSAASHRSRTTGERNLRKGLGEVVRRVTPKKRAPLLYLSYPRYNRAIIFQLLLAPVRELTRGRHRVLSADVH